MKCIKCDGELRGMQTKYCSVRCQRRHLKSGWQKRRREVVNKAKRQWRKSTNRASDKKWELINRDKHSAHRKALYAIKTGKLSRQPCEICKRPDAQAHHDDYSKPLDVRWLCPLHHSMHHHAPLSAKTTSSVS